MLPLGAAGRRTRREMIVGSLAAGGAVALGRAGSARAAVPVSEDGLLAAALQFERLTVIAYEAVIPLPYFTGAERRMLRDLLAQDRTHARVLERELVTLGYRPPPPPAGPDAVKPALTAHGMSGDLAQLRTRTAAVQILLDVEALCEGAYYNLVGKLQNAVVVTRAAQALACEGQHSTLLSGLLPKPDITKTVPYWFVAGVS